MTIQSVFAVLIAVQFIVVALHDLIDIPGWTHGGQVKAMIGQRKLVVVTLINAVFPGVAVAFAFYFWNRPKPAYVMDYWLVYCAVTLLSAGAMWYVPYLFGANEQKKREYASMYAGTRQVLPARGDNPRPNLLHVCFHVLFLVNFMLVLSLRFQTSG